MFGRFFCGKKVAKVVCNVAKFATLCISISPTTGWDCGQASRALKNTVKPAAHFFSVAHVIVHLSTGC